MESVLDTSYWITGVAFQRAIGLVYFIGFVVARNQFRALLGEDGLEPVPSFLKRVRFRRAPSLFHLYYSDRFFEGIVWAGIIVSATATIGLTDIGPIWVSMISWLFLWALYLSIVNVGQTFYSFGWESKLLDAGFLAVFLGPIGMEKPYVVIVLICWLLFRVELGAGLIKMRGDPCWRNLTCMLYHHETQPMPNPLSWFFHRSPAWMHKVETFCNNSIQLGVVWLIFAPQPIASIAGGIIILSQLWLLQSGNYSWLNFMTMAIALPTVSDGVLQSAFGIKAQEAMAAPLWLDVTTYLLAAVVALLSIHPIRNLFSRNQLMNFSFNPLHLVNTYGAFGSVTRERHEVVIEGADEANPGPTTEWKAYEFKGKPIALDRAPPQIAPYHLRLDWQLWFIPLRPFGYPAWFITFIRKLLQNDRQILKLLRRNPFKEAPPKQIRVSMYHYQFTTPQERRETGNWWKRRYLGEYLPPVTVQSLS